MSSQLDLLNAQIVTPKKCGVNFSVDQTDALQSALGKIFPSGQEETRLQRARRILGEDAENISDDDLEKYVTQFQSLIDGWLDSYEKEVFGGQTLGQLLREEI
jgi:hypothetical protein